MPLFQIVFGSALVLGLLIVAGVTAWYQWSALHALHDHAEEAPQLRGRAIRRLIGSVLMVLLALMLLAAMLFLEEPTQALIDQGRVELDNPENKPLQRVYGWFWVVFLLLLLLLLIVAAIDSWIVRRHTHREMRRLQQERRAMIEDQTERLRQERLERN